METKFHLKIEDKQDRVEGHRGRVLPLALVQRETGGEEFPSGRTKTSDFRPVWSSKGLECRSGSSGVCVPENNLCKKGERRRRIIVGRCVKSVTHRNTSLFYLACRSEEFGT